MRWLVAAVLAGDARIAELVFWQTFAAVALECSLGAAKISENRMSK